MQDEYSGLSERYDRFHGRFGEYDPQALSFFKELFAQHGVKSVFDCACGTGHDLAMFHALGCEVTGSDLSESMLKMAERNLKSAGLDIPLRRLDYRELSGQFADPLDAVVCLSSSILHVSDETEALQALVSMRSVLREGGILVLTQGTTDRQWWEKPRFLLAIDEPDLTRLFVIDYHGNGARYNIIDVVRDEEGAHLETWGTEYPHILLRDDYERLLQEAGFSGVDFFGDYRFSPYDKETSKRLIVVARK